jgi:hypothetical protein
MGLAQLPGVESALVTLGAIAQHPPRDTHYTYWLWNPGPQSLTFTGDPQERVFNVIVNHTQRLHQRTIEALRPVCRGDISFSDLASPEALRVATANMRELRDHFRSFMARADNGDWAMTPEFFMLRMRTYLTTYPIDGVFWGGVNATYLAEQAQVDFLVGTVHETYRHKVRERFRYMTREDTDAVQADMELPSIGAILLERLNLSEQDVMISSDEMLTARLLAQPAWLQRMTLAYVDLVTAAGQLSATHWSLIANYLMKPMQHLTPEQLDQLAVKPSTGVSGNGLEEAEMIRDMRRAHEVFSRLVAVTSSLRAAQSASE